MSLRPALGPAERRALLRLARAAIRARVEGLPPPPLPAGLPRLEERQGAFVTLRISGALRGCIGIVDPTRSLAETVAYCAAAAATEDPRFPSLPATESSGVSIEVTALAPPEAVDDIGNVVLGRHGLMVEAPGRRGVLLPQVALEQGWDVEAFVRETLLKAGLPADAVRRGAARLLRFEAEVISEEEPGATGAGSGSRLRSPSETG
jgi:AmmeMemoRadiSam system protein A